MYPGCSHSRSPFWSSSPGPDLIASIEPLRRWNIPEPVTGGQLAAVATLLAYAVLGVEISFTLDARDMLLLYFFTGIGLNARLGDLISGRRPLLVLLGLTLVYLVIQNLIAAGSRRRPRPPQGDHAIRRVRLAHRRPWHDDRRAPIINQRFGIAMRSKSASPRRRLGWWLRVWSAVRSPASSSRVII